MEFCSWSGNSAIVVIRWYEIRINCLRITIYVQVLLFSCSLVSFGLAKPTAPILGYQDSYGQYSFGYSAPGSARSEIRTLNGETRGVYSYVDDAGFIQTTQYTADSKNGFRVAATNLPQAPLPVRIQSIVGTYNSR